MKRVAGLWTVGLGAMLLVGCSGIRVLAPSESDDDRERIRALTAEVTSLEAQNAELKSALTQVADSRPTPSPEVLENAPIAVRLAVAPGSLLERVPDDPSKATLTLHISPLDSRDRFVQVTGWLDVSITSLATKGNAPRSLCRVELGPAALRDALRSGLFGNHYAVTCTLDLAAAGDALSAAAQITFRDGFSGVQLSAPVAFPLTTDNTLR